MKKYILFFIVLNNFILFIKSNQIIFPFKTEDINIESSNYIESVIKNKIYITIEIGEPPQKINLYLTMDTCFLMIANSSIDSSYYNSDKSKTYVNTSKTSYYFEYFSNAYHATENFIFQTSYDSINTKVFKNIEFIHVLEYSASNYILSGYFGLQLPKKNKMNIFDNFKKSNAISSHIFNLFYTSDNEGYLSIGELPFQFKDNQNEYSQKKVNALPCENQNGINNDLCWYLKFNDIKFGDIKVNRERDADISPDFGVIKGTQEYMEKIKINYFDKLFGNKCNLNLYENSLYYYECDKDVNISSFKDLIFSHEEFMYNFVLTKDDLFIQYRDKIYFLVVFDKFLSYGNNWILGKPFIKKYNFSYDADSKLILFYTNANEVKEAEKNKIKNKIIEIPNTFGYWIIIGILVLCVLVMALLVIIKVFYQPKKKLANELKEDIDYSNQENSGNYKENSLGI